jgi:hypothetical protein
MIPTNLIMHIDIGCLLRLWWTRPKLSEPVLQNLAVAVHRLGKSWFVERMRSEENRIVSPADLLSAAANVALSEQPPFCLGRSFLRSVWRSALDKVVLLMGLGLPALCVWYVGEAGLWWYVGIPTGAFLAAYFGIILTSMWRYSRWLEGLLAAYRHTVPVTRVWRADSIRS